MATEAQIAANRKNSLLSTGPRTTEGKQKSRANAIKHGLCASVVVLEDAELLRRRTAEMFDSIAPQDEFQVWLSDRLAVLSLRVDRSERMERRVRDKVCLKAALTWDLDREVDVERLAAKLASRPAEVSRDLRRTRHGCQWLIERWSLLARAAVANRGWTDDQTKIAFDLLGTPPEFRQGTKPGASIDLDGTVLDPGDDPAAVARRQVAALERQRDLVADLDEAERHLAESDLSDAPDAELRRVRRYESATHREVRWCVAQLQSRTFLNRPTRPDLRGCGLDESEPEAEPEMKPEPKSADEIAAEGWTPDMIHPPFDLEPDEFPEPGQVADIPAILASRQQKRLAKAESRRDARRRKLERLRA